MAIVKSSTAEMRTRRCGVPHIEVAVLRKRVPTQQPGEPAPQRDERDTAHDDARAGEPHALLAEKRVGGHDMVVAPFVERVDAETEEEKQGDAHHGGHAHGLGHAPHHGTPPRVRDRRQREEAESRQPESDHVPDRDQHARPDALGSEEESRTHGRRTDERRDEQPALHGGSGREDARQGKRCMRHHRAPPTAGFCRARTCSTMRQRSSAGTCAA
jgi:hypothetical protein